MKASAKVCFLMVGPPKPDPALISAHELKSAEDKLAGLVLHASTAADEEAPELRSANEQVSQAERRLVEAVPISIEGILAKMTFLDRHIAETCPFGSSDDHLIIFEVVQTVLEGLHNMARSDIVE